MILRVFSRRINSVIRRSYLSEATARVKRNSTGTGDIKVYDRNSPEGPRI